MTCPKHYPDTETLPRACKNFCPLARGVQVPETWHNDRTATQDKESPLYGMSKRGISAAVTFGRMYRNDHRREYREGDWHKKSGERYGLPLCAMVAYRDYIESLNRKPQKAMARLLRDLVPAHRDSKRKIIEDYLRASAERRAQGLDSYNHSDIARLLGVSRQRVQQIAQGAGIRLRKSNTRSHVNEL